MLIKLNNRRKKGQSTLEYAILVIIIIGALLSIQVYIKRGVSGRLKSATDDIGDQFSVGNTNIVKTTRTRSNSVETFRQGVAGSNLLSETVSDNMTSNVVNNQFEYWGK